MKIRKACIRKGHRWTPWPNLPFQFCLRYGCDGERVNPDYPMPDELRKELERGVAHRMTHSMTERQENG